MHEVSLFDLVGTYDNLGEPQPNINKRAAILGITITFMLCSWICGFSRLYTRYFVVRSPWWDDLLLIFALIFGSLGGIAICTLTDHGLGEHFIDLSRNDMETYLKGFYVANSAYNMSTALIKISLLLQYLRIFDDHLLRTICKALIVLISLWGTVYTILAWVPCYPVSDFWDLSSPQSDKTCFGYGATTRSRFSLTFESQSVLNVAFDVLVLSLPMWLYFNKPDTRLKTRLKTRMGMLAILFVGTLAVSLSIWRLVTLFDHKAATYPTFDPSWYSPISIVLSAVEVDVASICASVPIFWPVLRNSIGKIMVTKEIRIMYEDNRGDDFGPGTYNKNPGWSHQLESMERGPFQPIGDEGHETKMKMVQSKCSGGDPVN